MSAPSKSSLLNPNKEKLQEALEGALNAFASVPDLATQKTQKEVEKLKKEVESKEAVVENTNKALTDLPGLLAVCEDHVTRILVPCHNLDVALARLKQLNKDLNKS
eukprot:gene4672-14869_t